MRLEFYLKWNSATHTHSQSQNASRISVNCTACDFDSKYSCLLIINYELITCGTFKQRFHLHFTCLQWHANYSIYHFKRVHGAVQIQNDFFFLNSVSHLLWNRLIKSVFINSLYNNSYCVQCVNICNFLNSTQKKKCVLDDFLVFEEVKTKKSVQGNSVRDDLLTWIDIIVKNSYFNST